MTIPAETRIRMGIEETPYLCFSFCEHAFACYVILNGLGL